MYFLGILIPVLITKVAVLAILGSNFGPLTIQTGIMNIIIESSLFTLGIISYIRQRS